MKALGHVFKYGDNVDTDVIIPARYLNSFDGKELASHAMVDIDPEFAKKVQPGDLITVTIPDNQNVSYQVTEAVLADCPYVTSVEFCSPYYLRKISWDYLTENGQRIMYINDIRTSILNNEADGMNVSSATIDFSKVDKIVYVDDDGRKTILWENEI